MPLNTITDIYPMINETCCIYKIDFLSVNCFNTNVKYICNSYVLMTDSEVFLSAFVTAFWHLFGAGLSALSKQTVQGLSPAVCLSPCILCL